MGRPIAIERRLTEYSGGSDFIDSFMATQILAKGDGDVILGGAGDSNPRYSELAPYLGPAPITYRLSGDAIGIHAKEPGNGIIERDDSLNSSYVDADGGSAGMHAKEPRGIGPYKKFAEDPLAISPHKKYAEDPLGMKGWGGPKRPGWWEWWKQVPQPSDNDKNGGKQTNCGGSHDKYAEGARTTYRADTFNGKQPGDGIIEYDSGPIQPPDPIELIQGGEWDSPSIKYGKDMGIKAGAKPGSEPNMGIPPFADAKPSDGTSLEGLFDKLYAKTTRFSPPKDAILVGWPNGPSSIKYEAGVDFGSAGVDRVVLHADGVGYWKPPKIQAGGLQEL